MNASIQTRTPSALFALFLVPAWLLTLDAQAQPAVPELGNVLYNQTSNASVWVINSHAFTDSSATQLDTQGADDFVVPLGQAWSIDEVRMIGPNRMGAPTPGANVFLYPDADGRPGDTPECEYLDTAVTVTGLGLWVDLPEPCELAAGTWWLSVQGVGAAPGPETGGQHAWVSLKEAQHNPGLWREVNNGEGTGCVDWSPAQDCFPFLESSDFAFQILGTAEAAEVCISGTFADFTFAFTAASTSVGDGLFFLGNADFGTDAPWLTLGNLNTATHTFDGLTSNPAPPSSDPTCEMFPTAMWFRDFQMTSPGTFVGRVETVCIISQVIAFIEEDVTLTMEAGACPLTSSIEVEMPSRQAPRAFSLTQNYPNPFNPSTAIQFGLAEAVPVRLDVFDALGRKVSTLVEGWMQPGTYTAAWDGRSEAGVPVSGGVYVYRLTAGAFTDTGTMTLVK